MELLIYSLAFAQLFQYPNAMNSPMAVSYTHLDVYKRQVYDSLFQQLLWGYAIRNMRGTPEAQNGYYLPHLDALLAYLEQADASGFAAKLECLLHSEVTFAAEQLVRVGIQEASGVLY